MKYANLILFAVISILVLSVAYAQTVSHPASEITAGTFASGDFAFQGNLNLNSNNEVSLRIVNSESGGNDYRLVSTGTSGGFGGAGKFAIYDTNADAGRLVIDTSGNVGIGTLSPIGNLHVIDNGQLGISLERTVAPVNHFNMYVDTAGKWVFREYAGKDIMTLQDNGNVGIGTTNPQYKLHIDEPSLGSGALKFQIGGNDNEFRFTVHGPTYPTDGARVADGALILADDTLTGGLSLSARHPSGIMKFFTGGFNDQHERMRITSSGNVGIGTVSPQEKLSVNGNIAIGQNVEGSSQTYKIFIPWGGSGKLESLLIQPGSTVGAATGGDLILRPGGGGSGPLNVGRLLIQSGDAPNENLVEIRVADDGTGNDETEMTVFGDFSVMNGNKNFIIDHPTKTNMKLVHSSLEGPEIGVYYRGASKLVNGVATVRLPEYFEALTRENGRTIQLTAKGVEPYLLSYTDIVDGTFKVYGTKSSGEFSWEVKAARADQEPLRVERGER
jgi:hypothetical protein